MDREDYEYLCSAISNISGLPVRLYEGDQPAKLFFSLPLVKDPFDLSRDLFSESQQIGYASTEEFSFYGIVKSDIASIILGPARKIACSDRELRIMVFSLGVSKEDTPGFLQAMKSIAPMSLERLLELLGLISFSLNRVRRSIRDFGILDSEQEELKKASEKSQTEHRESRPAKAVSAPAHNTAAVEERLMNIVSHGDTASLQEWLSSAPAVESGILAPEQLRQRKNLFIVTATLVSRAAIRGGMEAEDALSLSDQFIQTCEMLSSPEKIMNLQFHMLREYTERLEVIRRGKNPTKLTIAVANYIQHHLSEPVKAEDIAKHLYMSRPYLSRKFREEAGESLTDFILREKTEEGKRLLRYTDKSVSAVSAYLGFSSQGHFSRTFRKYAGMTPREYRMKTTEM